MYTARQKTGKMKLKKRKVAIQLDLIRRSLNTLPAYLADWDSSRWKRMFGKQWQVVKMRARDLSVNRVSVRIHFFSRSNLFTFRCSLLHVCEKVWRSGKTAGMIFFWNDIQILTSCVKFRNQILLPKVPVFKCQKMTLYMPKQQKRRPLFNANIPQKWLRTRLF